MLPASLKPYLFSFILSGLMSFFVSGAALLRTGALGPGFMPLWLESWLSSWALAFPLVLVIAPLVRRLVSRLVAEPA